MYLSENSDLSELQAYPRLLDGWQWYSELCRNLGRLPSRQDIDPIDIKFALGYEMLSEVDRVNKNPRVRLIGLVVEEFTGLPSSATGKRYDQFLTDESRVAACDKLIDVLDKGEVLFGTTTYARKDGRSFGYARLLCPLSPLPNEAEMVFIIFQRFEENEDPETGAIKEQAVKRWLQKSSEY